MVVGVVSLVGPWGCDQVAGWLGGADADFGKRPEMPAAGADERENARPDATPEAEKTGQALEMTLEMNSAEEAAPRNEATALAGAALTPRISALTEAQRDEIVALRRDLHAHPELGNREVRTAGRIAAYLRALGLEPREGVAKTGVVARLNFGRPGPFVALRADIDGLPVEEATDLPFASKARAEWQGEMTPVMHACGHDVHTAALLGVATNLMALKDDLAGEVLFIFQPAEEGPPEGEEGGAALMLKEGVFRPRTPDAVFAFHTYAHLPVGVVGITPGPAWAAVDTFHVTLKGQGGHGGRPHLGVDPIVLAAKAILDLQTIVSRAVDPVSPAVVTVGAIHGGNRNNIIPEEVTFEGTVRTHEPATRARIERRMRQVLDGATLEEGASYTLRYHRELPPLVNDRALAASVRASLVQSVGAGAVRDLPPTTGGEDFAFFVEAAPSVMFRVGVSSPKHPSGPHPSKTFRVDDASLAIAIRALNQVSVDRLLTPG